MLNKTVHLIYDSHEKYNTSLKSRNRIAQAPQCILDLRSIH